jgi:uncharacterized membrane protein
MKGNHNLGGGGGGGGGWLGVFFLMHICLHVLNCSKTCTGVKEANGNSLLNEKSTTLN